MVRRAWRTALAGDLEAAEVLVEHARDFGHASEVTGATVTAFLQLGSLRWQQGRLAEALPTLRGAAEANGSPSSGVGLVYTRALVEMPEARDEARDRIAGFEDAGIMRLPRGFFWSSALVLTAETAFVLELPRLGERIRDELLPFADQVAFTGAWATAPIAYGIALAMAACEDLRSRKFLRRAEKIADRIQAPVLAAQVRENRLVNGGK